MDDYITKSDAISLACEAADEWDGGPNKCRSEYIRDAIEGASPADVRPVIPAQWIALDIYRSEGNYKCSNCGQPCYVPECMGEPMYSVCPNCGADMRPEEEL